MVCLGVWAGDEERARRRLNNAGVHGRGAKREADLVLGCYMHGWSLI